MSTENSTARKAGPRKTEANSNDLRAVLVNLLGRKIADTEWDHLLKVCAQDRLTEGCKLIDQWKPLYTVTGHLVRVYYRQPKNGALVPLESHPSLEKPDPLTMKQESPLLVGDCQWRLTNGKVVKMNDSAAKAEIGHSVSTKTKHLLKPTAQAEIDYMNGVKDQLLSLFSTLLEPGDGGSSEATTPTLKKKSKSKESKGKKHKKKHSSSSSSSEEEAEKHKKKTKKSKKHEKKHSEKKSKKKEPTEEVNVKKRKIVEVEAAVTTTAVVDEFTTFGSATTTPPQKVIKMAPLTTLPIQPHAQPLVKKLTGEPQSEITMIERYNALFPWFRSVIQNGVIIH